jgi:hypothetical protein
MAWPTANKSKRCEEKLKAERGTSIASLEKSGEDLNGMANGK